jgi:methionyl-tRNA synthetase
MSKSLGNVLDPFEVMDTFGTDALRYYCFREVSFGQDGSVSTDTFGERYETELANDYGNLASRTLAMIAPLPRRRGARRRRRPGLAADFEGLATRSASCSTTRRSPRRSSASGSASGGLNRYVEETRAVAARQGRGEGRGARRRPALPAEGLRSVTVLLHPTCPRPRRSCCARSGRRTSTWTARRSARGPAAGASERWTPLFPKPQ